MGEECILLGFVEAVDFINKQNGFFLEELAVLFRYFYRPADIGDARRDRGDDQEFGPGIIGDGTGRGWFYPNPGGPRKSLSGVRPVPASAGMACPCQGGVPVRQCRQGQRGAGVRRAVRSGRAFLSCQKSIRGPVFSRDPGR